MLLHQLRVEFDLRDSLNADAPSPIEFLTYSILLERSRLVNVLANLCVFDWIASNTSDVSQARMSISHMGIIGFPRNTFPV